MSAASRVMERNRKELSDAIIGVLESWPTEHRRVFAQSHYLGESAESISGSLGLSVPEVRFILDLCNQKLRKSLREYRKEAPDTRETQGGPHRPFASDGCIC